MFQTVFPSIIRSTKLHIQRQVFVRPLLLPAASLAGMEYPTQPHGNSNTHRTKKNTTNVVIQQNSRKFLMMGILMSETCWAHKKWNKIASDIKLVFYSSTITMMHGPINISSTCFEQFYAHPQERKTVNYSMWYNVPRLLSVGGLECGDTDYNQCRRRMGIELPEICWAYLKINKWLLLHLVGPLLHYFFHVFHPEVL